MGAVRYRFRSELRTRWRAWLGLAVLVGFSAGVVIAAVAGARRTDTVYDRFLRSQRAYDVAVFSDGPAIGSPFAIIPPDAIAGLPQVAQSARGFITPISFYGGGLTSTDGRIGRSMNRFQFVEGRAPDPERADEIAVGFDLAERRGLHVGSTVMLTDPAGRSAAEVCQGDPVCLVYGELGKRILEAVPGGRATIVGIEASPGEFPPQGGGGDGVPPVYLTPAFRRAVLDRPGVEFLMRDVIMVRLKQGEADRAAFVRGLEQLSDGRPVRFAAQRDHATNVQRSMHLQAVALWILAALVAVTAVLVLGQVLGRNAFLESTEYPTLGALGVSHRERFALGIMRAGTIGAMGAALAVATAVLGSPFTPTGLAGVAETNPGMHFDLVALAVGVVATIVLVVLLAAMPAWRAARLTRADVVAGRRSGRSRIAGAVAAAGCAPVVVTGVRMAVEPGRGRTAVPVRTSIVGVTLGVAVLAGTLTFGASLTYLLDSPRLYGVTWDLQVSSFNDGTDLRRDGVPLLRRHPGVRAIGFGGLGIPLEIRGRGVAMVAIDALKGDVRPPLVEGRYPSASDEILLGTRSLRRLGVGIGDTIHVRVAGATARRVRIVGRGTLPPVSGVSRLGDGALVTFDGGTRLVPALADIDQGSVFLALSPGTDGRRVVKALEQRLGPNVDASPPPPKPTDVVNFGRVENLPLVVGGVVALLAAATLAHVVVSATRRRRRDLAILKTLGFVRHQVRAAVAWQASTVTLIALALGMPLGLVAGRALWTTLADDLGIVSQPVVPTIVILLIAPAAILLANVIAVFPARTAARTRPAVVLRSE